MRKSGALMVASVFLFAAGLAHGQERGIVATARVGMPTDTLVNIADLYYWGAALELGLAVPVNDWFSAGGLVGYGFSLGKSSAVPEHKHQVHAAVRLAFGNLDRLSASLIGGVVVFLEDDPFFFPDIGISLDYRAFSLGLSTGSVSAGINFGL